MPITVSIQARPGNLAEQGNKILWRRGLLSCVSLRQRLYTRIPIDVDIDVVVKQI